MRKPGVVIGWSPNTDLDGVYTKLLFDYLSPLPSSRQYGDEDSTKTNNGMKDCKTYWTHLSNNRRQFLHRQH